MAVVVVAVVVAAAAVAAAAAAAAALVVVMAVVSMAQQQHDHQWAKVGSSKRDACEPDQYAPKRFSSAQGAREHKSTHAAAGKCTTTHQTRSSWLMYYYSTTS